MGESVLSGVGYGAVCALPRVYDVHTTLAQKREGRGSQSAGRGNGSIARVYAWLRQLTAHCVNVCVRDSWPALGVAGVNEGEGAGRPGHDLDPKVDAI